MKQCQQVLDEYEAQIQSLSKPPPSTATKDHNLENSLSTLDTYASQLEQGAFTLEEAFAQYQQSMVLVHECTHLLNVYEQEALILSNETSIILVE